ncbi:hypothetical protein [Deinococcus puniceus]|uniref:Uncharacterized protein n=1 Tax=Deinococcus puniceus TaxID=1182568 RepID=A0A172T9J7_9DEIO|nr:hypothetical protein [Deinococcus puniceus]ANE43632.1 hypothetical protein SU48_07445 [Deinococcus puniceus]
MAALLLCGAAHAQKVRPQKPRASAPFSTPYKPAYRPDDQPEFPLTATVDETRIAPGIWDTPPDLIGGTRVGVFTDNGVHRGFLFIGADESRIGEEYLVMRCVDGGQYELRLVLKQSLAAQAFRFQATWGGSTRTLKLGPADPELTDSVLLAKADATAFFGILLTGQKVLVTVSPSSGSGAVLGKPLALTFNGVGAAEGWGRIDRCRQ